MGTFVGESIEDIQRMDETRRRRRMLYGVWSEDLAKAATAQLGPTRASMIGKMPLQSNILRQSCQALATLYTESPVVKHDDPAGMQLAQYIADSGLWQLAQRNQRDVLGLRELLVGVQVAPSPDGPRPAYVVEYPDRATGTPYPYAADVAAKLETASDDSDEWIGYDEIDGVTYKRKPRRKRYYGVQALPLDARGMPVSPWVVYHAARTGALWDSYEWQELVDGSVHCAVLWGFFSHCVQNASWPQRYAVNASLPAAATVEGRTRYDAIVADPTSILQLETGEDANGQPMIGQWAPGTDPSALEQALAQQERRVAAYNGLSPSDVVRVAGDPRSGYALAITTGAQREVQKRFRPIFQRYDLDLIRRTAVHLNSAAGSQLYPETGYTIEYTAIPETAEERDAKRRHVVELLNAGIITLQRAQSYYQEG